MSYMLFVACCLYFVRSLCFLFFGVYMKKLTADVARRLKNKAMNTVHTNLQSIVDEIVKASKSRGSNTFIDLEEQNLEPFAEELRERGFKVWVRKEDGYLEVEWH